MNSSNRNLRTNPPASSLNRRGFLKLTLEALQIGVPVGIGYYLFARLRSYLLLTDALEDFTLGDLAFPAQSQKTDAVSEGWNSQEISTLASGKGADNVRSSNLTNNPQVSQDGSTSPSLQRIDGFILGDTHHVVINLADNERRIMAFIVTNSGTVVPTSRAAPFAYNRKAVRDNVFNTNNLSVLSFLGVDDDEGLCSWAHSGILADGRRLFADYLERGIRMDPQGKTRSVSQSIHFIEKELLGASVYLLQESRSGVLPYDPPGGFKLDQFKQGNILQLRINAAARVSHQAVGEYNKHVNGTYNWLRRKPRYVWQEGFSNFDPANSWILRTCLGTSADEPGFFDISYNRLILMFEPVIALRDPVFNPHENSG